MILHVDFDAAYLAGSQAKSHIVGYFQLSSYPDKLLPTLVNGTILIECKMVRYMVTSSAESETVATFHNAQIALPIQYMLTQLGYKQPPTQVCLDNKTTENLIHNDVMQKSPNPGTCNSIGHVTKPISHQTPSNSSSTISSLIFHLRPSQLQRCVGIMELSSNQLQVTSYVCHVII